MCGTCGRRSTGPLAGSRSRPYGAPGTGCARTMALRTRLTIVTAALMAVILAGVGAFVYVRLRADLTEAVDGGLRSRGDAILPTLGDAPDLAGGAGPAEPEHAVGPIP